MQVDSLRTQEKFKRTEIGEIPVDWETTRFENVASKFISGGTPDTTNPDYWDGDIPWITGADFEAYKVGTTRRNITKEGVENSATNIVPHDSLLVVTRTGVGKIAIAPYDIAISQDITGVIPDTNKADSIFLYWHFIKDANRLKSIVQGTSINSLLREDLASLIIVLPPLTEQKKIAEILSTVDGAIERRKEILEKTIELKKGLMQELLTRGIGHKKFKKTKMGKIPVGWKVVRLKELLSLKIAKVLSSVDAQIEKEIAHKVRLEDIKRGLMQVLLTGKIRVKV